MNNTIVWGFAQIIPPIYFLVVGMFLWFVQVLEASFDEKTIMILASILATIGGMGFTFGNTHAIQNILIGKCWSSMAWSALSLD